jgi:hypothetical protein
VPLLFSFVVSVPNTRHFIVTPLGRPGKVDVSRSRFTLADLGYSVFVLMIWGLLGATLWWIVRFFADRVFVMDVHPPDWAKLEQGAPLGMNLFLVRGTARIEKMLRTCGGKRFLDVRFEEMDTQNKWDDVYREIDEAPNKTVRVWDFEYKAENAPAQRRKLVWLQRVLARGDRTVLLVSARTPQYIEDGDWKDVFAKFACIQWDDVVLRAKVEQQRKTGKLALPAPPHGYTARESANSYWLDEETEWSSALTFYREKLKLNAERARLIDELGERAAQYYEGLWCGSSMDEKLLLFHLARYGFVHGKSRRVLRRLMARGLVRRDPNLEVLSETFRLYVLHAAQRDNLAAIVKTVEDENVLRSLRTPIFTVILALLLLLFTTQKDLLTATSGLAAALATGLPLLAKVLGVFADRRLESVARL